MTNKTLSHTPGPWAITKVGMCRAIHPENAPDERFDICRITPANYHPCGIEAADAEADATARLIAAAPDLLAALQTIANSEPIDSGTFVCDFETLQSVARAAIAKATGEQR